MLCKEVVFALSDTPPIIRCVVAVDVAAGSLVSNWTVEMGVWVRGSSLSITRRQFSGGGERPTSKAVVRASHSGPFTRWTLADHSDSCAACSRYRSSENCILGDAVSWLTNVMRNHSCTPKSPTGTHLITYLPDPRKHSC